MKILVLSDVQEFEYDGERGEADIVLSCGDNCDHYILSAAKAFNCRQVFAVKGNHDNPMSIMGSVPLWNTSKASLRHCSYTAISTSIT